MAPKKDSAADSLMREVEQRLQKEVGWSCMGAEATRKRISACRAAGACSSRGLGT